jgi:opacity protein-like surface antigen
MEMDFRFFATTALLILLPLAVQAAIRPVATISAGADIVTVRNNQTITIISPFQNSYIGSNHQVDFVGGLFLGVEQVLVNNILGQLGVSYYQTTIEPRGVVYQFTDPARGNLNYQYDILSQRILLESKLLGTFRNIYHPFINVGIGEALNAASNYKETPVSSTGVAMSPEFSNKTTHSFTYLAGVGIEMDIADHFRLGALYRYVNLSQAQLGATPIQESADTLNNNLFHVNQVLLQLTYLG